MTILTGDGSCIMAKLYEETILKSGFDLKLLSKTQLSLIGYETLQEV